MHHEIKNNLFRGDYDLRCSRKRRYDFPFIFTRKKVTAKANWIGLYWIRELKLYFKPSLFTKSLFRICFISLTVIGWSCLSRSKGSVHKTDEMIYKLSTFWPKMLKYTILILRFRHLFLPKPNNISRYSLRVTAKLFFTFILLINPRLFCSTGELCLFLNLFLSLSKREKYCSYLSPQIILIPRRISRKTSLTPISG